MARHRKSKKNVVQVNPNSTINYVAGILTGANAYIDGLLRGTTSYNAWVEIESSLEGTPIGEYRQDSLRDFMENLKRNNPSAYAELMYNPYEAGKKLIAELQALKSGKAPVNPVYADLINKTNYQRLWKTDLAMIGAGQRYRDMEPELVKSKNKEAGLSFLTTAEPTTTMYDVQNILKSKVTVK